MAQTTRNQIKAYKIQIEKNAGMPIQVDSLFCSHAHHDTQHGNTRDSTNDKAQQPQHTRRFDTCHIRAPIFLVGQTVACRRPGALVNKLESAWLEGVWLGRDNKTDGHLIETSNGMVRSRVQRRRWDTTLLNAMVWDLWNVTLVTRGRPIKVHSDREPILMRPIPKEHFNLPDDHDTTTTRTAAAAPSQETTSMGNSTICRRTNACEASTDRSRGRISSAKNKNISLSSRNGHN